MALMSQADRNAYSWAVSTWT